MLDTRVLLNKISAFRTRLEQLPRLLPDPAVESPPAKIVSDSVASRPDSATQPRSTLPESVLGLPQSTESTALKTTRWTARARRLLKESHQLIHALQQLADDPLIMPPTNPNDPESSFDPLAVYYRETATMLEPAVRMAQHFPDSPSLQLRLCDGLEHLLETIQQRLSTLLDARNRRHHEVTQLNTLTQLLVQLDRGESVTAATIAELAEQILHDAPNYPLRFLECAPDSSQYRAGAQSFPAPAYFVACHSLTTAQVIARLVRQSPEWKSYPHGPVIAALLHDVGMLRIPLSLLTSIAPIDAESRRPIEAHPRAGSEIVANRLPEFSALVDAIASHHERLDGTGYPSGLKGNHVPPLARLLAVADTYAALASSRPHRQANDPRTAITDTLLDAERNFLDRFMAEKLTKIGLYPIGSVVELSDGAIGVVAANHQGRNDLYLANRPVVNLLIHRRGLALPSPVTVDLAERETDRVIRTLKSQERGRILAKHYPLWSI